MYFRYGILRGVTPHNCILYPSISIIIYIILRRPQNYMRPSVVIAQLIA